MPKPKQGPALYDLLKETGVQQDGSLKAPTWVERRPARAQRTGDSEPPTAAVAAPPPASITPHAGAVELEGERVRLTFTSWTAALTVFVVLMIVLGAFEFGRRLGDTSGFARGHTAGRDSYVAAATDEIEAARQLPPSTDLIKSLLQEPDDRLEPERPAEPVQERVAPREVVTEQERPAVNQTVSRSIPNESPRRSRVGAQNQGAKTSSKWIRGYTYIVAQEFAAGREDDARRAQDFLADHRVPTDLVTYPSGSIQLITLQGYNRSDSTQKSISQKLLRKVHSIGEMYSRQGGDYKLEGYFKKLTGDSW